MKPRWLLLTDGDGAAQCALRVAAPRRRQCLLDTVAHDHDHNHDYDDGGTGLSAEAVYKAQAK